MQAPQKNQLQLVCISTGYCIYDIYVNAFVVFPAKKSQEVKEYLAHHLIGLIGALGVLHEQNFSVVLSCGTLLSVLSDLPMNFRWFLLVSGKNIYMPNEVLFLVSFFFLRVVFVGKLIRRCYDAHLLMEETISEV